MIFGKASMNEKNQMVGDEK